MPVIVPNSKSNHDEFHLDVNEHVLCVFMENGYEEGFVIGSFYDDENAPPEGNPDIRITRFSDGGYVKYDRSGHEVELRNSVGSYLKISGSNIEIHAPGNVRITGARIDLN